MRAEPAAVYRALTTAALVARWRVPDNMSSTVHEFEAREGGRFRMSLAYVDRTETGKTTEHVDTYHGHFVRLVPDELVVEVIEFETDDPALAGEMTMTTTISPDDGGVLVTIEHAGVPDAIARVDNETGTRMALDQLARLVEGSTEDEGAPSGPGDAPGQG